MAEAPIKLKNIECVIAGAVATNIISFKEEFVMNVTPQFMPNTFQGVDVLETAKWRRLTIIIDSDSDVFDDAFSVVAANTSLGLIEVLPYNTGSVEFTRGETVTGAASGATGVVESWTVTAGTWGGNNAVGVVHLSAGTLVFNAVENLNGSIGGAAMAASTATEMRRLAALPYDTGTVEFTLAETLTGAISGAVGTVEYWTVITGTWALNTAAGVVYISSVTDPPFQAENLTGSVGGAAMVAATGAEAAVFAVVFMVADAAGTQETWTYTHSSSYVQRKDFGRIEDGARRNTIEYQVLMYGTKVIS